MNEYQKMMQDMVRQTREDNADIIDEMPNKATTPGQKALERKHGTPRSFAQACVNAIGEISCLEAHAAIRKYLREWNAA
jgi:hypothetical protein